LKCAAWEVSSSQNPGWIRREEAGRTKEPNRRLGGLQGGGGKRERNTPGGVRKVEIWRSGKPEEETEGREREQENKDIEIVAAAVTDAEFQT